jgi:hypothetical protein
MSAARKPPSERDQLELFRALPGELAPRDAQDLMAYPFFSLSKSHRVTPIDFHMGEIAIRVEATPEHGMATIWDADVLIWAASQLVEARDKGLRTSRLMAATPYEILTFIRRGTSAQGCARSSAVDFGRNDTPATHGAAHAPLLLGQRMEGARRRPWPAIRSRTHHTRLALRGRSQRCARAHD